MFRRILFITILISSVAGNPEYAKTKLERNNILNKGVWVRNGNQEEKRHIFEKGEGDFLFLEENSLDKDTNMQYNFDAFDGTDVQDPMISTYVERAKRSNKHIRKYRSLNTDIKCKDNSCTNKISDSYENPSGFANLKVINDLRPASVFNDYPYEVAILLNSNSSELDLSKNKTNNDKKNVEVGHSVKNDSTVFTNIANLNETSLKRSMKSDYESKLIKKIEFTEDVTMKDINYAPDNKSNEPIIGLDKSSMWHDLYSEPVYNLEPKEKQTTSTPLTEKGLGKIISMLTKTFKKIIKQHNDIKRMHSEISEINDSFARNSNVISNKIADFDLKYMYLLKFNEKIKVFEAKLASKEEYFNNKEKEMVKSFKEFEKQQQKFLQQQKQFFNVQKLMLAQNERINVKQNVIAKSQSEISHRQNAFAKVLKKAKQLFLDSKNYTSYKLSKHLVKPKDYLTNNTPPTPSTVKMPTTSNQQAPTSTETIKIDLFSIPISNKIEDQDDLIIQEKDDRPIDDLVYKYYFNNTYIDNVMKNKILPNGDIIVPRNTKRQVMPESTLLFPVIDINEAETQMPKNRERRWISHHSKRKHKRKYRGKQEITTVARAAEDKMIKNNNIPLDENNGRDNEVKKDPFLSMSTNFCNEVQQKNSNESLALCIEKVLRKLANTNYNISPPDYQNEKPPAQRTVFARQLDTTQMPFMPSTLAGLPLNTASLSPPTEATSRPHKKKVPTLPPVVKPHNFPDNEILEWNLRQYVIDPKPEDVKGNVYYEGSVHASQIASSLAVDRESQGIDDILPGMDSNSRYQLDPVTFDVQARRRAFVRQLNERIKKSLG